MTFDQLGANCFVLSLIFVAMALVKKIFGTNQPTDGSPPWR
jgi:hypothetical protein